MSTSRELALNAKGKPVATSLKRNRCEARHCILIQHLQIFLYSPEAIGLFKQSTSSTEGKNAAETFAGTVKRGN